MPDTNRPRVYKRKNITMKNFVHPKPGSRNKVKDGWRKVSGDVWVHEETGSQASRWQKHEIPTNHPSGVIGAGFYASRPGMLWIGPFETLEIAQNVALYIDPEKQE